MDDPTCPECTCVCDGHIWPRTLCLTIASYDPPGKENPCPVLVEVDLVYDEMEAEWIGTHWVCDEGLPAWEFRLACEDVVGDLRFSISSAGVGVCCSNDPTHTNYCLMTPPDQGSTCYPVIDLTFQFTIPGTWLTCTQCCGPTPIWPEPTRDPAVWFFYITEGSCTP